MIVLLVISLLFISSCNVLRNNKTRTDVGGVDLGFIPGYLPDSFTNVPVNTPVFRVGLVLINNLENDVNGELCIRDTLSDSFGGIQARECNNFFIRGKEESGAAERTEVYFPVGGGSYEYDQLPHLVENTQILAELSYEMETRILADICLNGNPAIPVEDLVCDPNEIKITKKEFAPVTITDIQPRIQPLSDNQVSVSLKMKIKKANDGDIVAVEDLGHDVIEKKHLLDIFVSIYGTPGEFRCTPSNKEGRIRVDRAVMKGNQREIECDAQVTLTDQNYVDSLEITLRYGYEVVKNSKVIPFEFNPEYV